MILKENLAHPNVETSNEVLEILAQWNEYLENYVPYYRDRPDVPELAGEPDEEATSSPDSEQSWRLEP